MDEEGITAGSEDAIDSMNNLIQLARDIVREEKSAA